MITDDTLREGLQTPGMSFTISEKIQLARLLSEAGIKRALVSYPSAHKSEVEVTREIVSKGFFRETYGLGRTVKSDIDIINGTGANISLHLPFEIDAFGEIVDAVKYASKTDKIVEVGIVDIAKINIDRLMDMARKLEDAGADVIQLPDTTGSASPQLMQKVITRARETLKCKIEVHCHNDSGGAVANALAGVNAGTDFVDTCIYGLGERNGITDTASVARLLEIDGVSTGIDHEKLSKVYARVMDLIMDKIGNSLFIDNFPCVGRNTNVHTAGTHAAFSGVFKGESFSVNVYTGRTMIKKILELSNINLEKEQLIILTEQVKDIAVSTGKTVTTSEIVKLARERL